MAATGSAGGARAATTEAAGVLRSGPAPNAAARRAGADAGARASPASEGGGSLAFARAARLVADVARAEGWLVPGFRSPPRLAGAARTVRRRADGGAVVAVAVRGRPWAAVAADLVEGVVVTNRLSGSAAHRCRARLWEALAPAGDQAA